jgi:hypothetical protein
MTACAKAIYSGGASLREAVKMLRVLGGSLWTL